jgi:hypothetical protein
MELLWKMAVDADGFHDVNEALFSNAFRKVHAGFVTVKLSCWRQLIACGRIGNHVLLNQ